MLDHPKHLADRLIDRLAELDACDGCIVLVRDAQTGETDALGPFDGMGALCAADRTRFRFELDEVDDIEVTVTRFHHRVSAMTGAGRPGHGRSHHARRASRSLLEARHAALTNWKRLDDDEWMGRLSHPLGLADRQLRRQLLHSLLASTSIGSDLRR